MRTKKILFALLALGVMSASAFAEPTIESIVDKQVTVSCDATTGKSVALTVVRKNYLPSQIEWVVAVKEDIAEDGEAVFQFNMPDAVNNESIDGEYVIYIKENGKQKEQTDFLYVAPKTRESIKASLQGVTTKDELAEIFNNPENDLGLKFMGYNMDSYNALPGEDAGTDYKDETIQGMFDSVGDFGTATDETMAKSFENVLILNHVNSSATSDDCEKTIGAVEFEGVIYEEIENSELKDWIKLCIFGHKPYASHENVITEYKTSNILYKLNTARFSSVRDLLATYADDLGISKDPVYEEYKKNSEIGRLNEAIASRLADTKPQTAKQLMAEIDTAMKSVDIIPPSSGGGSSSGGGGSSSGSYSGGADNNTEIVLPIDRKPTEGSKIFDDVEKGFWGEEAIRALAENKVIAGDGNGRFRPNDVVTREEFVKMVVSIMGDIDETAACDFKDISKGDWCYKYVANAVNKGVIYGKAEGMFGRGEGLSRQDMAVICMRVIEDKLVSTREDVVFSDESNIADYAKAAVHKLYCAGIVSGADNNQFLPSSFATRAQAAQILYKTFYN